MSRYLQASKSCSGRSLTWATQVNSLEVAPFEGHRSDEHVTLTVCFQPLTLSRQFGDAQTVCSASLHSVCSNSDWNHQSVTRVCSLKWLRDLLCTGVKK